MPDDPLSAGSLGYAGVGHEKTDRVDTRPALRPLNGEQQALMGWLEKHAVPARVVETLVGAVGRRGLGDLASPECRLVRKLAESWAQE